MLRLEFVKKFDPQYLLYYNHAYLLCQNEGKLLVAYNKGLDQIFCLLKAVQWCSGSSAID